MKEIVTEDLLKKIDNRFLVSIVAAKRARQLKEGAVPLVEQTEGDTELTIALKEILEDKIQSEIVSDDEQEEDIKVIEKKPK